jgi:hypothetical protein
MKAGEPRKAYVAPTPWKAKSQFSTQRLAFDADRRAPAFTRRVEASPGMHDILTGGQAGRAGAGRPPDSKTQNDPKWR